MEYGFNLAQKRRGRLTSVTKSNALQYSMVLWDKIFREQACRYPGVAASSVLVDAMAMYLVREPENFDVVVTSNLFGDILSDLGAALQGGLGFAPGANLDPSGKNPSMFEPIHGSSPQLAGKGIANPIATIWAGSLMLEHLGEESWSRGGSWRPLKMSWLRARSVPPDMGAPLPPGKWVTLFGSGCGNGCKKGV